MSVSEGVMSVPLSVRFELPHWEPQTAEPTPARELTPAEERRLRRMISNRDSARRSRMRKQRHLDDLQCQMNRLQAENRDLAGRLGAVSHYCNLFRRDNDRLRSESAALHRRLSQIRLQLASPTPCGGFDPNAPLGGWFAPPGSELNNASLIV